MKDTTMNPRVASQILDSAMYTFEELFTEEIKDTDAKTNGRTAADKMRSVKEDVLGVSRAFPFRHRENAFFFCIVFFFCRAVTSILSQRLLPKVMIQVQFS